MTGVRPRREELEHDSGTAATLTPDLRAFIQGVIAPALLERFRRQQALDGRMADRDSAPSGEQVSSMCDEGRPS
jgi:hypothetical protein